MASASYSPRTNERGFFLQTPASSEKLVLKDGTVVSGKSFGARRSVAGEVVFATGMVGYPESLTDPSYAGQILVFSYPLIGNYGVAGKRSWESSGIKVSGLVVSDYIETPSHHSSRQALHEWLEDEGIPALEVKDTRFLVEKLRDRGSTLGKIIMDNDISFFDPNQENLVARVSTQEVRREGRGRKTIVFVDCGAKRNIVRSLLRRRARVITVPWNYDMFQSKIPFHGLVISNGPGDPKAIRETIQIAQKALARNIPTLGICLGNQILALAAGGDTYKMKFGHRGQNQPCTLVGSRKSYLTTQNHGFAVGKIPRGFRTWFVNANDGTNEGLIHERHPVMSVQFHPEARPGPEDTDWIFDYFLKHV
ncbi:carbamoyl-phosphate synthase (glutamine-hydrolyzing) small subunit [Candidatus Parcubacteria bacterium]|nr:MAG: carbamoyl-phosphate synthase (glutamine-hydrolyzing) small subunit [Candidatus Parcubacteria bacterium]